MQNVASEQVIIFRTLYRDGAALGEVLQFLRFDTSLVIFYSVSWAAVISLFRRVKCF
jgi:hypothetical protein